MFKGFEWNKDCRIIKGKSMYAQEHALLHELCASEHENIRLEYSTDNEARNAMQAMKRYIVANKMPLTAKWRGLYVYVVKVSVCE